MPLRMPTSNPNLLAPYTDFLAAIDEMVAADPADPEVGQQKKEKRYGEVLPSVW